MLTPRSKSMHHSLAPWHLALTSMLILQIGIGSIASPYHLRPSTHSSSHRGPMDGSAMPSESSLEQRVTFRPVPTHSMLWITMLASQLSLPFYTIIPMRRNEGCSSAGPNIRRTYITDSNNIATTQRVWFHKDVIEQDGVCILAGLEVMFAMLCTSWPITRAIWYATITLNPFLLTIAMGAVHFDLYSVLQLRPYWG